MGIDPDLFVCEPDQELICPICYGVLEEPIQGSSCDHLYCNKCIKDWLKQSSKCPVDREFLSEDILRQPPKLISNLISRMEIRCFHSKAGCDWIVKLGRVDEHLDRCPANPKNPDFTLFERDKSSPLKQMRLMADLTQDLTDLRCSITSLSEHVYDHMSSEKNMRSNLLQFESQLVELEAYFKEVTDPLVQLMIKRRQGKAPKDAEQSPVSATATISVSNLNEFICSTILQEYLRQQGIFVIKCTQSLGYNERSRNFMVTIRDSDKSKMLSPSLWPEGVVLCEPGHCKSIHGGQDKVLPSVAISSGMSYWHN